MIKNGESALIIMDLLESIKIIELFPHIENAINKAIDDEDFLWLSAIKELVER